jgi:hypothetical protein
MSEEIGKKAIHISKLPPKLGSKEIDPNQGMLDLKVDRQMEIQGVGMGVLSDGTPFLTQRGLARLCGVENAHIGTISAQWDDEIQTPRVSKIRALIESRGERVESPHIVVMDGNKLVYAYNDAICLAVLEYYAFEAGANCKEEARTNFRRLAGKALQDFIYTQVGYDPTNAVPDAWRQFHDRVSLTYSACPKGYFSVFKEIADMIVTLGQAGLHIDATFVPDISVGRSWSEHWKACGREIRYGARQEYEHNYPSYFPQAASNPQTPFCYPEGALGEFRRWFRETYIGAGKFANYINTKVKQKQLPASFAQLAIAAYEGD